MISKLLDENDQENGELEDILIAIASIHEDLEDKTEKLKELSWQQELPDELLPLYQHAQDPTQYWETWTASDDWTVYYEAKNETSTYQGPVEYEVKIEEEILTEIKESIMMNDMKLIPKPKSCSVIEHEHREHFKMVNRVMMFMIYDLLAA